MDSIESGLWGEGSQSRRTSLARRIAGAVALATALGLATPVFADEAERESPRREVARKAGMGVASALASIVYAPAKIAYATGGLLVGGLAYAFSGGDSEVAETVMTPALRGDYIVTPSQLKGEKKVEFFGRDPAYQPEPSDVAAEPLPSPDDW